MLHSPLIIELGIAQLKKLLVAATALSGILALTGAALAADPVVVDPAYDWTGFYIGATAGYGWGESRITDPGVVTTGDFDIEGFIGGATLGGNWQSGDLVFGVEGDISFADIDGSGAGGCSSDCFTEIEWLGTLRGRGGFAINDLLIFAAGGLAVGDVFASSNINGFGSNTETRFGWTVGGGLEWAVTQDFSVKAEYLFVDLGHVDIPTIQPTPDTADVDETHIFRVGVNFHF